MGQTKKRRGKGKNIEKCPDSGNEHLMISEGVREMNLDVSEGNKQRKQPKQDPVSKHMTAESLVTPLQSGWNWAARSRTAELLQVKGKKVADDDVEEEKKDPSSSDDDDDYDDDDDDCDEYGSEIDGSSAENHESRKQHKKLKFFFKELEKMAVEEINNVEKLWHCPACQGGPGAIDWYKGLQPLMTHARTKGSRRVKLHRNFADVLDEELKQRGASIVPAGEAFGLWEGLKKETKDHDIIWPAMVMIMNTRLDKDLDDKWKGMGNAELMDYFQGYAAVRSRHSYGPTGHRGMSVLIFESSAMGYVEAKRLHEHFLAQGTGRIAWEGKGKVLFCPGGKRQLYGFLARRDDLDEFNRHSHGKSKVKYEIRSYHQMVELPMKKMSEDNQRLTWLTNKAAREQVQKKALEQSFDIVSDKLRLEIEENRVMRQRAKMQHEENIEVMDFQEQHFKGHIQELWDTIKAKEEQLKLQEKALKKVEESSGELATNTDSLKHRREEETELKDLQEQEMESFMAEKEKLKQIREAEKSKLKNEYLEQVVRVEEEYDAALARLINKYAV